MDIELKLTCVTAVFQAIKSGNREKLIRCVDSVAQIPVAHEHLIYDGGSTDGTVELLRELETKTPGLKVTSEQDNGIYDALNKGVKAAKGKWFYVLGCDDYIACPDKMCLALDMGDAKQADLVGSSMYEGAVGVCNTRWRFHNFLFGNPFPHQGILMRTVLIRKLDGFDLRYSIASDFDLIQRAILSGVNVVKSPVAYACFSLEGVSSQGSGVDKGFLEKVDIIKKRLSLSAREATLAVERRVLPMRTIVMLMAHGNMMAKRASFFALLRTILYKIRRILCIVDKLK